MGMRVATAAAGRRTGPLRPRSGSLAGRPRRGVAGRDPDRVVGSVPRLRDRSDHASTCGDAGAGRLSRRDAHPAGSGPGAAPGGTGQHRAPRPRRRPAVPGAGDPAAPPQPAHRPVTRPAAGRADRHGHHEETIAAWLVAQKVMRAYANPTGPPGGPWRTRRSPLPATARFPRLPDTGAL